MWWDGELFDFLFIFSERRQKGEAEVEDTGRRRGGTLARWDTCWGTGHEAHVEFVFGEGEHSSDQIIRRGWDSELFLEHPRRNGLPRCQWWTAWSAWPTKPTKNCETMPEILWVHTAKNVGKYPCDTPGSWNLGWHSFSSIEHKIFY